MRFTSSSPATTTVGARARGNFTSAAVVSPARAAAEIPTIPVTLVFPAKSFRAHSCEPRIVKPGRATNSTLPPPFRGIASGMCTETI
jgi:hypothetical protein